MLLDTVVIPFRTIVKPNRQHFSVGVEINGGNVRGI
jgi:hypothetical protein